MAKHAGKPSPTRLWPVALQGKERKSRGGEERKSMWKGKEEDSEGTQADVQGAIPADSILLSFFLSSLSCSPLFCSTNPSCPPHLLPLSVFVCSDLGSQEEKTESKKDGMCEREKKERVKERLKVGIRMM